MSDDEEIDPKELPIYKKGLEIFEVEIDNSFTIYVASLHGIFLLKLSAWRDRKIETNKYAEDIAFVI